MEINDTTKLYLVKAMVEGIPCNFEDVQAINDFSQLLINEVENNKYIDCFLSGDADGILISNSVVGSPYATIIFSQNRITFRLLVPEDEIDVDDARNMARIVLNTVGLAKENVKPPRKKQKTITKTYNFRPNKFGIIM